MTDDTNIMDVTDTSLFSNFTWAMPWPSPRACDLSADAMLELRRCAATAAPEPHDITINNVIANSKNFPIAFPIDTVRLESLKMRCPVKRLQNNIESTYPILHERVVILIANFLVYKRKYGSSIEKKLYEDMSIEDFLDRILKKRAVTFMKAKDEYKLLTGETGCEGWELVGTEQETPPLVLENCLSYDEMKVSALVAVSGRSECVNSGGRWNAGRPSADGVEDNALIIGFVGPRFKRRNRMEYEDILVSQEQNTSSNGYGRAAVDGARRAWRQMWDEFYQIPSITYSEIPCSMAKLHSRSADLSWVVSGGGGAFRNVVYARRVAVMFDVILLEADARAQEYGTSAFLNIIGAGLGIWRYSRHQLDVYVAAAVRCVSDLLASGRLTHVSDVNFAYIEPAKHAADLFKVSQNAGNDSSDPVKTLFLKCETHPRGGINVQLENREPSSKLEGPHAGKLLALTYAWDSNAHPGNEFWLGKLTSSGDSANASSTQVSELHNGNVNPRVCATHTRVAAQGGVRTLKEFCQTFVDSNK